MDKEIKISIKINSETGEVVALKKEFDELTKTTKKYSETEKNNRKETKKSNQEFKFLNDTINKLKKNIKNLIYTYVGFKAITATIQQTVIAGINLNKTLEDAKYGIAALITASTTGESTFKRFNIAVGMSKNILNELRLASINTAATFPELTDIFTQSIGDAISAGKAMGKNLQEIIDNTIKLDERMSNIANAIGMPMWQVNQEVRSILEGTISQQNSRIATMLHITNAEINKAKQTAGGLIDYLNKKLAAFDVLAKTNTFSKELARVKENIDNIRIAATKPIFNDMKEDLYDISAWLKEHKDEIVNFLQNVYYFVKNTAHEAYLLTAPFIKAAQFIYDIAVTTGQWAEAALHVKNHIKDINNLLNKSIQGWNLLLEKYHEMFPDQSKFPKAPDFMPKFDVNLLNTMIHKSFLMIDEIKNTTDKRLRKGLIEALKTEIENIQKVQSFYASKMSDKQLKELDKLYDATNKIYPIIQKLNKEKEKGLKLAKQSTLTAQQMQNIYKQIHNAYESTLPQQQQLKDWYNKQLALVKQISDKKLREKALNELNLAYQAKLNELQDAQYKNQKNYLDYAQRKLNEQIKYYKIVNGLTKQQQSLLKQLKQQYTNLLPPKEQIEAWYKNIVDKINKIVTDPKFKKQALEIALKIKVKKEEQANVKQEKDNTITFNSFTDMLSTSIKKIFERLGEKLPEWANILINHIDTISFIVQKGLSYLFDDAYNKIKSKYTDLIDNLQQSVYTKQLQVTAYNAFGLQGQGALTQYQASVANIQMLQTQNAMNYELMRRAKHYKEITQHTLETLSIAAGTAAAIWFDGGAVLEGIKMAIKAQDWAEQATGFKNFQQAYIDGVNKFKQAVRDLADNLIQIAGSVYKSIKDYRNIFDKITGTSTYKVQNYKESLSFISKYSDLTTSALANLTQNVLKASKGFVEGAVKSASDFKKLVGGEVFKKYGLAIEALNDKFKNSLSVIANLIDMQRQAKDAIADYVAELKGSLGDTTYNKRYTQGAFAQALKDYYAGKVDGSTLLEKAKAYQNAGGDVSKIIKTLQGVEAQSTKDYLKGILKAVTTFNAVGLPYSNIQDLTSPQVQTLNVIKDTKNILQDIMDILKGRFRGFGNLLSGILDGVSTIVKLLENVLGAIIGGVTKIISGIAGAVENVAKTLVNALSNLGKFIGNLLGKIGNFALSLGGSILDGAGNLVGSALHIVSHLGSSIGHSIGHAISHVFHGFHFAQGGYTGTGIGQRDSTGEIVAGVVHAGEWVAPAWMVNSMPNMFNALESLRVAHSVNNSLFNPVVNVAVDIGLIRETNAILVQQLSIQKKMLRLMQKFDEEGIKCVS